MLFRSCHHLLPSSFRESIWFLSGRWRLQTSIASQSGWQRPRKKAIRSTPNWKARNVPDVFLELSDVEKSPIILIGLEFGACSPCVRHWTDSPNKRRLLVLIPATIRSSSTAEKGRKHFHNRPVTSNLAQRSQLAHHGQGGGGRSGESI